MLKYFGDIPKGKDVERNFPKEKPITESKRVKSYDKNIQIPAYVLAYRTPPQNDRDSWVLNMISTYLSDGESSKLYKKIALDLIFKSPQLQQLDYKASRILGELFKIFFENYVSKEIKPLFLLGADAEALLNEAKKDDQKSRIISDIISEMTDRLAVRTYRRLIDPNFGSIMDLV